MQIYSIKCTECGEVLAYSYIEMPQTEPTLCYLCMHNLCDMAEVFHADFPIPNDLYIADEDNKSELGLKWRAKVIHAKSRLWQMEVSNSIIAKKRNLTDEQIRDIFPETFSKELDE